LVYARGRSSAGVIFLRFDGSARRGKVATVVEVVSKFGSRLADAFTVVDASARDPESLALEKPPIFVVGPNQSFDAFYFRTSGLPFGRWYPRVEVRRRA
jgi:hypothetical protein